MTFYFNITIISSFFIFIQIIIIIIILSFLTLDN